VVAKGLNGKAALKTATKVVALTQEKEVVNAE
jgi:hypothetical protein